MVSQRGIEANLDKVKAIIELKLSKIVKKVKSLTRKVTALNRFISRATDECMPFFKVFKKNFQWTDECEEALAKLKEYLTKPPLLSPSVMGEELYLYLAVSNTAVSSTLIREEENVQKPVYYTSQAFQGVEANYPRMEKIAFALVVVSRKLRPYFQSHSIVVMINQPIRKTMNKIDAAGQLIPWAIELGQLDIKYWPRATIKAQAKGDYETKEERIQKYLKIVEQLSQHFDSLDFVQIPRAKNIEVDFLASLTLSDDYNVPSELCIEIRGQPSIEGEQVLKIKEQEEWMTPIVHYLKEEWLPEDKTEARKIQIRAARFVIIDDILYKRGYSLPYLRFTNLEEMNYVLHEIHE
ncbi:uncharacterized protein LOC142625135 [Castanea sativa]|uniref:uncharacterized protein LOC142625135 n=1 Tax=Castanea sativa TaxID=21020 RepID=UPI003F64DEEC